MTCCGMNYNNCSPFTPKISVAMKAELDSSMPSGSNDTGGVEFTLLILAHPIAERCLAGLAKKQRGG